MLKKYLEGSLWGAGFSTSIGIFFLIIFGISFVEERISAGGEKDEEVQISNFKVLELAHRVVPSSDELKGGLIVSGVIELPEFDKYEYVRVEAEVFNNEGVYIDTCDSYSSDIRKTKEPGKYYFKADCYHITSKEQFSDYKIYVTGVLNENS